MALKPWEIDRRRGTTSTSRPTGGARETGSYYASKYGSPTAQKNAADYYGMSNADKAGFRKRSAQQSAQKDYWGGLTDELQGVQPGGSNPLDPGGPTTADLATILGNAPTVDTSGGGPGGGGRGGGGSGAGGAGADPAVAAALQEYMASIGQRQNPYNEGLLGNMFDTSRVDQRYDRMSGEVGAAGSQARDRLAEIAQTLTGRTRQAGTQIDQGFSNRMAALQQLAGELQQGQQADVGGLDQILAANTAGSVEAEAAPLQNLMTASQTSLGDAQNMFRQSMADRAALSGQLQSDVGLGLGRDENALMSQIASRRASETGALQDRRQQALADITLKGADWEAARQAEEAKLRMELASLGIQV